MVEASPQRANMGYIGAIVAVATIGGFLFGYDSGAVNGTQEGLREEFGLSDAGLGFITAFHYDHNHQSAKNRKFVADYNAEFKRNPDMFSVGGYDGMHVIYEALKKTKGDTDGDALIAAAKGLAWESPRGSMSIDPETRDVVQTVYIRRVEKVGGQLLNVEFDKIENVKDPFKARLPK